MFNCFTKRSSQNLSTVDTPLVTHFVIVSQFEEPKTLLLRDTVVQFHATNLDIGLIEVAFLINEQSG